MIEVRALLAAAVIAGGRSGVGSPVEVVVDVDASAVRTQAQAIAEATWKEACALYGDPATQPDHPLALHVYREIADYDAACDRLHCGNLKRNLAFSEWRGATAHVLLQPPIRGEALEKLAPPWQTLRLIAHETAHLARFTALPNHESHPGWFADGNASWLEARVLAAKGLMTAPEQSPFFSTEELRAQRAQQESRLPTIDDLLHDRTDALDFFDRYAVRWLLFRWFMEGPHSKPFHETLKDVRQLGGGDGFRDEVASALKGRIDPAAWDRIDSDFRVWILGLKPEWDEVFRSLETNGDDWTQSAFDDANAIAFRTAPAGPKSYAIEGTLVAYPDRTKSPQMNLLLGRQRLGEGVNRFVSIAFAPGERVTLFDYDGDRREADRWTNLGGADAKQTAPGRAFPFRVECELKDGKTAIAVKIAGKLVTQAQVDRTLEGPWGLGAQAGSSGVWRGVRQVAASSR